MTDRQVLLPPRPAAPDPLGPCPICGIRPRAIEWVKVARVAEKMARTPRTIRRLIASGQLDAVRFGRSFNISHESLDRYIAARATADEA